MNLFYLPEFDSDTQKLQFAKDESRHLSKSLRKKEGDTIRLTNGRGLIATVELTLADPKHTEGVVLESSFEERAKAQLHIAIAPTKMNERFEWFLEKATELGVNRITPIVCENSERRNLKQERMQRILVGAMKQSLRSYLPILDPLIPFDQWLSKLPVSQNKWIAHCAEGSKTPLDQIFKEAQPAIVLIGPEGDFSGNEVLSARNQGFNSVSLGHNRLRTETAGVAVTAIFNCVNLS